MKKLLCSILMALVAICGFVGINTSNCDAAKKVVAVTEVVNSCCGTYGRLAAQEIESELVTALVQSGMYDVVERTQLDPIIREMNLGNIGMISGNTAIEFGNLTGANYTVIGSIVSSDVSPFNNHLYKGTKAKIKFNFKFVDNKTGQIKIAEMIEGSNTVSEYENKHPDKKVMLSGAVTDVAKKIVAKISEINPIVGTVAAVNGDIVYIDLGSDKGVHEKDEYVIYREGNIVTHPVTGEILPVETIFVGTVKIKEVHPNYSIGEIKKEKQKIQKNDKVKRGKA